VSTSGSNKPRTTVLQDRSLDVVGIGALNLDYIVRPQDAVSESASKSLSNRMLDLLDVHGQLIEPGAEHSVDEGVIYAAMETASLSRIETSLGGSAFNAIRTLAQTKLSLRLGFVGAAGRVPVMGMSSLQHLDALGIDRTHVVIDDNRLSGICLSIVEGGDRTLLTHSGANSGLANYLVSHRGDVVDYLSRAKIIHLTSFLDDLTAKQLLPILTEVRLSDNTLTFDPGHVWCTNPTDEIRGLLALSDYILLNYREFSELSHRSIADTDQDAAQRLLKELGTSKCVLVVKQSAEITTFSLEDESIRTDVFHQPPLRLDDIEDSTGAGDVFAAGLLAALTSDQLQIELGALLGMRLTRHKLKHVGSQGSSWFPDITRSFFESLDSDHKTNLVFNGVFIAHGGNPDWIAVKLFVEERVGLPTYSFESDAWGGLQVTSALSSYLDRCGFAICVLTAEDLTTDGHRVARQNVIHEIGLFQGRHGFDKVVILAEEGCELVAWAGQVTVITFPHNAVSHAFYELGEVLKSKFYF
jgi:sugar/nucleoside kinase (ribokinase family)